MRLSVDRDVKRLFDNPVVLPLVVLGMVVVGGILRLVVARQDLFGDELATYWVVSTRGVRGVVETVSTTAEITPPLSFVLSWLTTRLGRSPELVRLPALVAGIAAIPLVYAVGTRTVGRSAAVLGAALTTLSPFMIFYSAEARGYGLLMGLLLLSTLALLLAIDTGHTGWWVLYGLCVCLAAYTHYTAVFVLVGQLGWAVWAHPPARRPALIATAVAALLYLPWMPSVKGDVDSPTTDILSAFSPLTLDGTRLTLGHWTVGFPYGGPTRSMSDLPGMPALLLLAVSLGLGAYGIFTMRSRLKEWFAPNHGRIVLILVLALATPVGSLLQSAVGANVFSTRSLAASWPYLALAVAALITVGRPVLRLTAAALAVTALAIGAAMMTQERFHRPDYTALAQLAADHPGAVVVDGAAFTPGPLTNFDVESSSPGVPIFRLSVPAQMTKPFGVGEQPPDPAVVAAQAIAAADGGPIIVMAGLYGGPPLEQFVDLLPEGYELTDHTEIHGLFDLQAQVYQQTDAEG